MKDNIIKTKSFEFALRIIKLFKHLQVEKKEYILITQILRSGTSVGALVRESEHAQSTTDFIHKLSIAQKEANETEYWLELLYKSEYIEEKQYNSVYANANEICKILAAILKSSKTKNHT